MAVSIYAKFVEQKVKITIKTVHETATDNVTLGELTENGGGKVQIESGLIETSVTAEYYLGYDVTLKATPNTGFELKGWFTWVDANNDEKIQESELTKVDEVGASETITHEMAAETVVAWFTQKSYKVDAITRVQVSKSNVHGLNDLETKDLISSYNEGAKLVTLSAIFVKLFICQLALPFPKFP